MNLAILTVVAAQVPCIPGTSPDCCVAAEIHVIRCVLPYLIWTLSVARVSLICMVLLVVFYFIIKLIKLIITNQT